MLVFHTSPWLVFVGKRAGSGITNLVHPREQTPHRTVQLESKRRWI